MAVLRKPPKEMPQANFSGGSMGRQKMEKNDSQFFGSLKLPQICGGCEQLPELHKKYS